MQYRQRFPSDQSAMAPDVTSTTGVAAEDSRHEVDGLILRSAGQFNEEMPIFLLLWFAKGCYESIRKHRSACQVELEIRILVHVECPFGIGHQRRRVHGELHPWAASQKRKCDILLPGSFLNRVGVVKLVFDKGKA